MKDNDYMVYNKCRIEDGYKLRAHPEDMCVDTPHDLAAWICKVTKDAEGVIAFTKEWTSGNIEYDGEDVAALISLMETENEMLERASIAIVQMRKSGEAKWNGLDAAGMAGILDELWGAGTFDDDQWDDWFKAYGSPYRVVSPPTGQPS